MPQLTKAERNTLNPQMTLSVEVRAPRQYFIESNWIQLPGEWNDIYVGFSGYFGSLGPQVFAAAPDLLSALEELTAEAHRNMVGGAGHLIDNALAAIAKARRAA